MRARPGPTPRGGSACARRWRSQARGRCSKCRPAPRPLTSAHKQRIHEDTPSRHPGASTSVTSMAMIAPITGVRVRGVPRADPHGRTTRAPHLPALWRRSRGDAPGSFAIWASRPGRSSRARARHSGPSRPVLASSRGLRATSATSTSFGRGGGTPSPLASRRATSGPRRRDRRSVARGSSSPHFPGNGR